MTPWPSDPDAAATAEIERLHRVFEGWFQGTLPPAAFDTELVAVLHPEFEMAMPSGEVVSRAGVEEMRAAHGSNPAFRIEIHEPRLLGAYPAAGLIHAQYVEAQFGARNTTPADHRRRSTVLFELGGPHGLLWRHLHETLLRA